MQLFEDGRLKLKDREQLRKTSSSTPEPAILKLQGTPHDLEPEAVVPSSSTGTTISTSAKGKRKRNNDTKVKKCYIRHDVLTLLFSH